MSSLWPTNLLDSASLIDAGNSTENAITEADSFARGFDEGLRTAAAHVEQDRAALAGLIASVETLNPPDAAPLATMLVVTVRRLVGEIVGNCTVDGELLGNRCSAICAYLANELDPVLFVNPQDAKLLPDDRRYRVEHEDTLPRGTVRATSAGGWVEDGIRPALARLDALLVSMGVEH